MDKRWDSSERLPRCITNLYSDWLSEIQNLFTGKLKVVLVLQFYLNRADVDGNGVFTLLLRAPEHPKSNYQIAEGLRGIREEAGKIKIQIDFSGFPDRIDCIWEPMKQVFKDMLDLIRKNLETEPLEKSPSRV